MDKIKNYEEIKRDVLSKIDSISTIEGSFADITVGPVSMELEKVYTELNNIQSKQDIENLEGEDVDRYVYPRTGQIRKQATKSTTLVIISGQEGTKIKKGDFVSSDNVNFLSLEDKTVGEPGVINLIVECEEFEAIGNVPANSINRFPVTIPGLIDVYNPDAVINGYDAETDRELKDRYYEKFQKPAKAGNKYHYEQWAKEVVGVGGVRVVQRFNGPLTMKIIIVDANGLPASEELIDDVEGHIKREMPFGVKELLVIGATPKTIDISVTLLLAESFTDLEVKESMENNVKDLEFPYFYPQLLYSII